MFMALLWLSILYVYGIVMVNRKERLPFSPYMDFVIPLSKTNPQRELLKQNPINRNKSITQNEKNKP
jgi:hypothetical protein